MKYSLWIHWVVCLVLLAGLLCNHVGCAGLLPAGPARDTATAIGEGAREMSNDAPWEMRLLLMAVSAAILGIPLGKGVAFLKTKNSSSASSANESHS